MPGDFTYNLSTPQYAPLEMLHKTQEELSVLERKVDNNRRRHEEELRRLRAIILFVSLLALCAFTVAFVALGYAL